MPPQKSLGERADLEDVTADRAAEVARHAEAEGYSLGAAMYWKLAHRCRVESLKLRALEEAGKVQNWRFL